jgi:hypothetical protein
LAAAAKEIGRKVQITPAIDGTMYSLITHWSSASAIEAWRESAGYRLLPALVVVSSETFVPAVEDEVRDRLRPTGCSATGCSPASGPELLSLLIDREPKAHIRKRNA